MSQQNIQILLQRIGQQVGIPDLGLDDDDTCQIRIDSTRDIALEFLPSSEQLILTAYCGQLPARQRTAILEQISDANFHWVGTGGGTLSTQSESGAVYLQFREPTAQMDQPRLEQLLQALIQNAEYWGAQLAAADTAPDSAAPHQQDGASSGALFDNRA
ncbi:type III secretion system chaperone [Castellaniella sp.]|uniref:type III secretion system chaperone n=1 Tax=Castellaniella sp. TaxID=1955812 RepID=UPI002AFDF7F5|nr:type III secretion system chaperone [Castellaniella sp.]